MYVASVLRCVASVLRYMYVQGSQREVMTEVKSEACRMCGTRDRERRFRVWLGAHTGMTVDIFLHSSSFSVC